MLMENGDVGVRRQTESCGRELIAMLLSGEARILRNRKTDKACASMPLRDDPLHMALGAIAEGVDLSLCHGAHGFVGGDVDLDAAA